MTNNKRTTEKIITCPRCAGVGYVMVEVFKHYNDEPRKEPCPDCKGKGRLVRSITLSERPLADNEPYHIKTEIR